MSLKQKFIHYVSANMISMIGLSLYILADTFFIAKGMGAHGLTALNLALPVYNLISGLGMLIAIGGAAQFITYKSTENNHDANNVFLHGLVLVLIFGVLFIFTGIAFSSELATILGANKAIHSMTSTYLQFVMIFAPAFMLNNVLSAYTKNDGDPHLAMIGMLAGSLFNIVFDYIFIFPLHLGMLGAVLATGFSPVVGILVLSTRFINKSTIHLEHMRFKINLVLKTFTLGFPSLINEVSGGIVMLIFNYLILHIAGNIGVAAYGVIVNIYLVIVALFNGIAQGVQPLMGECYAKGDHADLEKVRYHAIILGAIIAFIVYLLMLVFKSTVVSAFNSEHNSALQSLAESGLILYFIAPIFASYNIITIMYLISINQPLPAQLVTLLRGIIILIPAALILSSTIKMTGIWLTLPLTELLTALIAIKIQYHIKRSVH